MVRSYTNPIRTELSGFYELARFTPQNTLFWRNESGEVIISQIYSVLRPINWIHFAHFLSGHIFFQSWFQLNFCWLLYCIKHYKHSGQISSSDDQTLVLCCRFPLNLLKALRMDLSSSNRHRRSFLQTVTLVCSRQGSLAYPHLI